MKGYSQEIKENKESYAMARVEGIDASVKDLAEVCGRMNNLTTERAFQLLEDFKEGKRAVLYKTYNKRLGHRKELGGRKGRYPKKAAKIIHNLLKSAVANAMTKGMIEPYIIVHLSANTKRSFPRLAPKGARMRSNYVTARVEMIIREKEITKKDKKIEKMLEKKPGDIAKAEGKKEIKAESVKSDEKKEVKKPEETKKTEIKSGKKKNDKKNW